MEKEVNWLVNYWRTAKKAVLGSVVAFIAALIAEIQSGSAFDVKSVLLALGTAVVTHATVYQVSNEDK
jgi:hypothetical protein